MNFKMNTSRILWFFVAICFIVSGIRIKNISYIILGCAFICIACTKKFTQMKKENSLKGDEIERKKTT